jgi:hypothetical protein
VLRMPLRFLFMIVNEFSEGMTANVEAMRVQLDCDLCELVEQA